MNEVDDRVLLRLENVGRTFQMGEVAVHALKSVSLDIYRGEFLVMVGPSGSGKTTLLNIIGGMDQPTSGRAIYAGHDLTRLSPRALTRYRRERIGFVFQFYNLVPNLTAIENVMVASEISRNPLDEHEALEMVGLAQRKDHFPSQLSGGEQQRVAIARAVANAPLVLLADEPTGNLDPETASYVFTALEALVRQSGLGALIATHNHDLARRMDRCVTIEDGKVVAYHPPAV